MEENNKKRKIVVLVVVLLLVLVAGATFAWWTWTSANNTKINFTVSSTFSCSADGGGNITSNDVTLVPSSCTNSSYAIKREITVGATLTGEDQVFMDLWLDINELSNNLSNSNNFMYAITESDDSCEDPIKSGNFNGKTVGNKVDLLSGVEFTETGTDTYYLWIWLDSVEANSNTMNQSFDLSLNGSCTTAIEELTDNVIYTANIYDMDDGENTMVRIGYTIPNSITQYSTKEEAMNALKNIGGVDYPFFLKHVIGNKIAWCLSENGYPEYGRCIFNTQTECENYMSISELDDDEYSCTEKNVTNGVIESYIGFIVTPEMVTNNPGITPGTYHLRDNVVGETMYNTNKATLLSAFGNSYCNDDTEFFSCEIDGLYVEMDTFGNIYMENESGGRCFSESGASVFSDISNSSD